MKLFSLAALAALLLAGCTDGAAPGPSPTADFAKRIAEVRADAVEEGANATELAILDEAAEGGVLTMEQFLRARDDYAACLHVGGYELIDGGTTTDNGYPYPDYTISVPVGSNGEDTSYMDDCAAKTFQSVDYLYQTQPQSQQGADAQFDAARPQITACLEKVGVVVPDDLDRDEFKSLLLEQLRANFEDNPDDMTVQDCLSDAGINGF